MESVNFPVLASIAALAPAVMGEISLESKSEISSPSISAFAEVTVLEGYDFGDLLTLPKESLSKVGIGAMNIICAQGLPGGENIDLFKALETLEAWAQLAKVETDRHLYKFQQDPGSFENSEAYFRMLVLTTVLQQDCGIKYAPDKAVAPLPKEDLAKTQDFYKDSQDIFIHGLLSDERTGTCASLPVLLVAVGRRLGYPLYLVSAKSHAFARWNDPKTGEKFNIEYHGNGMTVHPDEYYHEWPYPMTKAEINGNYFMRSMSPHEELAVFMLHRGFVLEQADRLQEAQIAYARGSDLMPEYFHYQKFILEVTQKLNPHLFFQAIPPFESPAYKKIEQQKMEILAITRESIRENYALKRRLLEQEKELEQLRAESGKTYRHKRSWPPYDQPYIRLDETSIEIDKQRQQMLLFEYEGTPQ